MHVYCFTQQINDDGDDYDDDEIEFHTLYLKAYHMDVFYRLFSRDVTAF